MKSIVKTIVALVLCSSAAFAAGEATKEAKPVACRSSDIASQFKDQYGNELGICGASKPGGKVTVLRSFVRAKVIDPATDKPVIVLVGFR